MIAANVVTGERAAMFAAQLGHESVGLRYMEEIASGAAYEGRRDLGNVHPGDGTRYKGRGPIQLTGRNNYRAFTRWAREMGHTTHDFEAEPWRVSEPHWGFLAASWYWVVARPQINNLADRRDLEGVTRAINGGLNGLADRRARYQRALNYGQRLLPDGAPMAERYWPLPKNQIRITSRFAGRTNPVTGRPENHSGTDFAAPDGTPFYACQSGTVQFIGPASGYGQWLVIDSSDAEGAGCVEYGHMWNAYATGLKVGDKVRAGQLIGYVGSNGQSTGPHLHVTVWERGYRGRRIDPETWLAGAKYLGDQEESLSNEGSSPVLTQKYFTDFITGWLGPQIDAIQEIWRQLRGPNGEGWPQLGQNNRGQNLTLVDAIAALRQDVAALRAEVAELKGGRR